MESLSGQKHPGFCSPAWEHFLSSIQFLLFKFHPTPTPTQRDMSKGEEAGSWQQCPKHTPGIPCGEELYWWRQQQQALGI